MRVAVLGPLVVTTNDSAPVSVPGADERLLLAVLTTQAPGVVPTAALLEALRCGGTPAPDGEAVHDAVRRLRSALEPGLPERSSGQYVLRRGPGYALAVPRGDVDASRFSDLARRGHARVDADPAEAEWLLSTALGLWRGEPYGEWPHAPFAEAERRRLAAARGAAEADLLEARARPRTRGAARAVSAVGSGRPPLGRPATAWATAAIPRPRDEPPPVPAPQDPGTPRILAAETVTSVTPRARGPLILVTGLVVLLVAALFVARLSGRSEQRAGQAVTAADADRLAALSRTEEQLGVAMLLAAQAYRLADTSDTRGALTAVLDGHQRVERAVSFYGVPQDAVLSGGRTLTFGVGVSVVGWPVGPETVPREILPIPGPWGEWIVAAPSPVEDVVLGAGMGRHGAWIRRVSTLNGTSHLLAEGDQVGGRPVAGAVSPDGRQLYLVVAQPYDADPDHSSRWHLIDVDVPEGSRRDTGITGVVTAPLDRVAANFAEDAGSFVVWDDDTSSPSGTLVQLADGRQVPIPVLPGHSGSRGFHAYPGGAVQLWDDGGITLVGRDGKVVQELGARQRPVHDVAVSPDGRWAVTGGNDGEVFRWDIDPSTGRWSGREALRGHTGDVVSVELDAAGRLLATVSVDHTAITWDMSNDGPRPGRGSADPKARLHAACAIAGRDLTPVEWRRILPDRPWQPTCSDVL
ncbi:MAG: BTAD domain-containing putative transcriptional regulator [Blastococcus sp.]